MYGLMQTATCETAPRSYAACRKAWGLQHSHEPTLAWTHGRWHHGLMATDRDASHVWLSYAEAAEVLGISARAVEGRAYRGHWEKQRGNDGTVRLAVPRGDMEATKRVETPTNKPTHGPTNNNLLAELKVAHEEAVGLIKQRAEAAEARLAAVEQERAEARERAARLEGELEGMKLGVEHQHAELAQMRREVAEAHNRAVVAEQQVIEATERQEGAEEALARARSWNFLNFLFGREGKGRKP